MRTDKRSSRRLVISACILFTAAILPLAASAAGQGGGNDVGPQNNPPGLARADGDPSGKALGMVKPNVEKAHGGANANPNGAGNGNGNDGHLVDGASPNANKGNTANLTYHLGPVMATGNTTYAIYWLPCGFTVSPSPRHPPVRHVSCSSPKPATPWTHACTCRPA